MNRINKANQLIMAEHDEIGIWYFTSSIKLCEFCKISYASYYMTLKGATPQVKGWTFSIVEDNGDIPRNFVDPKNN